MPQERSAYVASIDSFLSADPNAILGDLAKSQAGDLTPAQRDAWLCQIGILKRALEGIVAGTVLFEFLIPRMGKRADNVLLIGGLVIVIEFKVGAETYDRAAKNQAIDYALDLKEFPCGKPRFTNCSDPSCDGSPCAANAHRGAIRWSVFRNFGKCEHPG